jgi:DNA-binding NtrC family response regulator
MGKACFPETLPGSPSAKPAAALVMSSDLETANLVRGALNGHCSLIEIARGTGEADALLERYRFDVLIVDARSAQTLAHGWLASLRSRGHTMPALVLGGETAAATLSHSHTLHPPFSAQQLAAAVRSSLFGEPRDRTNSQWDPELARLCGVSGIVGQSEVMRRLLTVIQRVGAHDSTVLLQGESGTGKEIAARGLHHFSGRRGPFVAINCGAISPALLESELFGHAKGAFTGASQAHQGVFSSADGGTLFLDEIGEMPLAMQAKLLRVLEQRTVRPVGATQEVAVNVRVVAATNRRLVDEVARGNFREDLYFRLNVIALHLPPLRERPDDIPGLVKLFTQTLAAKLSLPEPDISEATLQRLQTYSWPGNVRELKNAIERALLLGTGLTDYMDPQPTHRSASAETNGYPESLPLEEVEKRHILKVLDIVGGNKSEAARRLQISRKTLERKLNAWRVV